MTLDGTHIEIDGAVCCLVGFLVDFASDVALSAFLFAISVPALLLMETFMERIDFLFNAHLLAHATTLPKIEMICSI